MRLRSPHPSLWIGVGSVMGLLFAERGLWGLVIASGVALSAFGVWWKGWSDRGIWALGVFAVLGWLRGWWDNQPHPDALHHFIGKAGYLYGYLLEEPVRTAKAVRLLLRGSRFHFSQDTAFYPIHGKLLLYTRDTSALHLPPGQRLLVVARLDSVRFGQTYWHAQGVYVSTFSDSWKPLELEKSYLMGYFYRWRLWLIRAIREYFPGSDPSRTLIEALLLGYKRGLDPEVRSAFQLSGVSHILAVSGLHVGLVLTFALFLVGRLLPAGADRKPYVIIPLIGMLFFYGFLTAASPSAVRAVLMGSVALVARMLYRPYAALNAMGLACFLQLLADSKVLYNLGFQLSYAAVAGILAWYSPFRQFLSGFDRLPRLGTYIKDLIAISLAAQLGTLGISWAYFGQFPVYFLLANLVTIPVATALSYVGVLWLLVYGVPFLGVGLGWGAAILAEGLLKVVSFVSALPGKAIALPPISPAIGLFFSLAAILAGFAYQALYPRRKAELIV